MPFEFHRTDIEGLMVVEPRVFADDRGFFLETYKKSDFIKNGIADDFVQSNHSKSKCGVLRGLHYQVHPFAQAKLIRCTKGKIYDVAVDIRKGSPTFKNWYGLELSSKNKKIFYVPIGFAHGFYTLSPEAEVMYKTTAEYSPEHDRNIIWNDPDINIQWPDGPKIVSEKDRMASKLIDSDVFQL